MKAVYCKNCKSMFLLAYKLRKCECGKSKGKYINWHSAVFTGKDAIGIGIENPSFQHALLDIDTYKDEDIKNKKGMILAHSHFVSYTVLQNNLTFYKVDDLNKLNNEFNKKKKKVKKKAKKKK